jgi:alanine racemase
MDYAMLDVTDIPGVAVGDEVTLLGTQGAAAISAEEAAGWLDTSAYEVLATLLPRGRRVAMSADPRAERPDPQPGADRKRLTSAPINKSELR